MKHSEPERSSAWKKIAAVVLFGGAIAYAIAQYTRLQPEPPSPPPLSSQWARMDAEKIDKNYAAGLTAAGLTEEQQEALRDWERRRGRAKDDAEKKALREELNTLLTKEQIAEYQRLQKERSEQRAALRTAKDERLKNMIGERDFERHKADMQKVRDNKQAKKEAAKQPEPEQGQK